MWLVIDINNNFERPLPACRLVKKFRRWQGSYFMRPKSHWFYPLIALECNAVEVIWRRRGANCEFGAIGTVEYN